MRSILDVLCPQGHSPCSGCVLMASDQSFFVGQAVKAPSLRFGPVLRADRFSLTGGPGCDGNRLWLRSKPRRWKWKGNRATHRSHTAVFLTCAVALQSTLKPNHAARLPPPDKSVTAAGQGTAIPHIRPCCLPGYAGQPSQVRSQTFPKLRDRVQDRLVHISFGQVLTKCRDLLTSLLHLVDAFQELGARPN